MGLKSLLAGKPSSQTASTGNTNNSMLAGSLGPAVGYANQAGGLMSGLLGGNTDALNAYANSGGMKFLQQQGAQTITSQKAAQGLLGSGSYGTALADYGQKLASTYLDHYMQGLQGLGNLGVQSGAVLADSGRTSTEKSTGAKPGLISMATDAAKAYGGMGGHI